MGKSKIFKNCLALLLITLVAGAALACVNEITKEPIAQAEEKAKAGMKKSGIAEEGQSSRKRTINNEKVEDDYG